MYECYRDPTGYTCLVLVNGREYQTDLAYESDELAQENAAMRAFMVCRNFSVNGGMLARNGVIQGLPASESRTKNRRGSRPHGSSSGGHQGHHGGGGRHGRRDDGRGGGSPGHHSSSSSVTSSD